MKKKIVRVLSGLMAILCLLPLMSVGVLADGTQADDKQDQALYVEKYVSVLYDNSGSMLNSDNRAHYATYAIQMMASMMNTKDKLWITPMNISMTQEASLEDSVEFPLTDNREKDIASFVQNYLATGKPLAPINGAPTPPESMGITVDRLYKTDDIENYTENRDRKHWAIILTDGAFTKDGSPIGVAKTVEAIREQLERYDDMNVIFVGMGEADNLLQNTGLSEEFGSRFTAFKCDAETVVDTMRDVVNLMSDRYTLKEEAEDFITMSSDGKTATVKLSYVDFPLHSISFAIQDFGGKLTKAVYSGKTFTPANCVITPPTELDMLSGSTGIIRDTGENPMMFNTADNVGDLKLYFDKPVKEENIVLMAEPALYIEPVFQFNKNGSWQEGTAVDLSKQLASGDRIRVGYRVFNGATGAAYTDLKQELPGETFGTVYFGGSLVDDNLTGFSNEIVLSSGKNEILLRVSLMDGIYRLEKKTTVEIMGSTDGYSMKAELASAAGASPAKSVSIFTPLKNTAAMTAAELAEYTATVTVKNASGAEINTGAVAELQNNGTYKVSLDLTGQSYGEYALVLTLEHNRFNITMQEQTLPQFYPSAVDIKPEQDKTKIEKTENGFARGQTEAFSFLLTADGKAFDYQNGLLSYELSFYNPVTKKTTAIDKNLYSVKGNRLTFVPDKKSVGALMSEGPCDYTVTVSVSCAARPALCATTSVTLAITETTVLVRAIPLEQLPIDRFDISSTPAEMYFAVYCDDYPLTEDELRVALGQAERDEKTATVGTLSIESKWCENFFLPVNLSSPEIVSMTVDGKETACVKVVIEEGHIWGIRGYSAMLINTSDKEITATYQANGKEASDTAAFVMATSSWWSYLWRTLLFILIAHIILFILTYNKKGIRHKRCYVVMVTLDGANRSYPSVSWTSVNVKPGERFIPARTVKLWARQGDIEADNSVLFTFKNLESQDSLQDGAPSSKKAKKSKNSNIYFTTKVHEFAVKQGTPFGIFVRGWCEDSSPESNFETLPMTNEALRAAFPYRVQNQNSGNAGNVFDVGERCTRSDGTSVYACYSEDRSNRLEALFFFAPRKKK